MLRVGLLWLYVLGVGIYAWKDWYLGLCGLILLVAVIQHPDMPKSVGGIPGLNPWNVLFLSVVASWLGSRAQEHLTWDMPSNISWFALLYLGVVAVGTARLLAAPGAVPDTFGSLISEQVINTLKWPILGLMLFDGCRSRSRFVLGLTALLAVYFLIGLQVIRWMPWSALTAVSDLEALSRKLLSKEVGFHPVNLSMMFAGAFWAMWVTSHAKIGFLNPSLLTIMAGFTFFAQVLTAGRMGYVTWAVLGLFFSVLRWRKYLVTAPVLIPVIIFALTAVAPGAVERMQRGFSKETADTSRAIDRHERKPVGDGPDMYTVTSGRTFAWSFVIAKIAESPVFGYGRKAMVRTGIHAHLWTTYQEDFPHPHNAYLEMMLDNGVLGLLLILPFYFAVLKYATMLFRDSSSPIFIAGGGVACALVLALLVASWGSQTFYPREGSVGMWCAIGLALRVYVERERILAAQRRMVTSPESAPVALEKPRLDPSPRRQPGALLRPKPVREHVSSPASIDSMLWAPTT